MADDSRPIPPFVGIVHTTRDALLLFEGARRSVVPRITRRLMGSEAHLITSGAIFIFDELESGIKRWTDGLVWSPSRIMSNFVVYREANQRTDRRSKRARQPAFTTSSSSRANSSHTSSSSSSTPFNSPRFRLVYPDEIDAEGSDEEEIRAIDEVEVERERRRADGRRSSSTSTKKRGDLPSEGEDREREIVGSLMPSIKYKTNGLIKKTISISINGVAQHLVSYFTMEDALLGRLKTPSSVPELASISIPADLLQDQQFRSPPGAGLEEEPTLPSSQETAESTPSSRLLSTRRASSAEPLPPAPPSAGIIPVAPPSLKRKRSYSLATTTELETLVEERRRNSFPLPSYASTSLSHLEPPRNISLPSRNISRPEAGQTFAFLSPMQEDSSSSSIGAALTPGSLQRTMASLDAYEMHGTHAGWKAVDGLEDGLPEEERRRTGSSERDASTTMDWDPDQPQPQPSSSSSFSSSSTMEGSSSYYHLPYHHPSIQIQIHPPPLPLLPPVRPLSSAKSYFPPTPQADSEHGGGYGMKGHLGGVTLGVEHEREEIVRWVGEGTEVGVDVDEL